MAKTKISEFSPTPGNNTDIDGINIAEGCPPSSINNAIRELMSQLKDFQAGTAGDSFNGPIGTTTAAAGAFTTLSASGAVSGVGFSNYLASPPAIGGTAAAAGSFTTLTTSGAVTHNAGTANGVAYLNGSKVLTTGSALTFDGTTLTNETGSGVFASRDNFNLRAYAGSTNATVVDINSAGTVGVTKFSINSSEQMRLTSTGLGIGTSSPAVRLHANVNAASEVDVARFQATNGADVKFLDIGVDTTNNFVSFDVSGSSSGAYVFRSGGTERMRLDSSGNLGLGVTPSVGYGREFSISADVTSGVGGLGVRQLAVGNNFTYLSNNAKNTGAFSDAYWTSSPAMKYQQSNNGHTWFTAPSGTAGNAISFTQAMTLDTSGNLLVGTTVSRGRLTVESASGSCRAVNVLTGTSTVDAFTFNGGSIGSITTNGISVAYNTTSDYRLKTVIGPVADAGQRIDALQPVEYTWNASGERTRGFLAHQFQEVYAGSVSGTKDAVDAEGKPVYQAMQASTPEVIADLVAELQSLRARVARLESN